MDLHTWKLFCDNLEQNKFSEALKYCDDMIQNDERNTVYLCNRASLFLRMEMFRRCIKECDAVLQIDPKCLKAYLLKGKSLFLSSKKQEAQSIWADALRIPGDVDIHMQVRACLKGDQLHGTTPKPTTQPANDNPSDQKIDTSLPVDTASALTEVAAKGLIQYGVGKKEIDEQIAFGYLQVNTGNFKKGIEIFSALLRQNSKVVAAFLGRGTASALVGDIEAAIRDFSAAIEIDPNLADSWKRRGQARAARGLDNDAIQDLTVAVQLDPKDADILYQRSVVYHKQKNFRRAYNDAKKAVSMDRAHQLAWNQLGISLAALGSCEEAINAFAKAVSIDEKYKEAWCNMGQTYKELGIYDKAEQLFNKTLGLDPNYVQAYQMRAFLRFYAGMHTVALTEFTQVLKLDPSNVDSLHMRGVVQHGLGLLRNAIADYQKVVKLKPDHVAWYQCEIAKFVLCHLDTPVATFNIDRKLDPYFKESWCKRNHPAVLARYQPQPDPSNQIKDVTLSPVSPSSDAEKIINYSKRFGVKLQLNSPGYLPNKRQQACCGLAVVELAQTLKQVWNHYSNGKPLMVDGGSSSGETSAHPFGWRDMYDVLVRWRQYSEPNDPVWWVDLLSPEQFEDGFGSHTPMITGQTNVVRYYPMFKRAFAIMKELLPSQHNLDSSAVQAVREVKDCQEMYEIMKHDFWVTTPCYSVLDSKKVMEGTRLTMQYHPPEGFEYSIRTPGTPPRWKEYDQELTFVWDQLVSEAIKKDRNMDNISNWILTMTFFWYNFMPLSRGTAAVGYAGLLAMFLSFDIEISVAVPKDVQVDWEGILTPKAEDFIKTLSWMYPARVQVQPTVDKLPSAEMSFCTVRAMLEALNAASK